jgi:hypothetical protein
MAKLGKKVGTIAKASACITGYGTACITYDGDEVGIVAPTMRGLKRVWGSIAKAEFDEAKVRRVAYFPHEALTTLRPRKRRAPDSGGKP